MTGDKSKGSVRINRYEREVNRVDIQTASELATQLDVPLAYLFSEDDQQAELILAFASLDAKARAEALEHIRRLAEPADPGRGPSD